MSTAEERILDGLIDLRSMPLPKATCPDINSVIKIVDEVIRDLNHRKRRHSDEELRDVMDTAANDLSDVEGICERLRRDNQELRDIAEQALELAEKAYAAIPPETVMP